MQVQTTTVSRSKDFLLNTVLKLLSFNFFPNRLSLTKIVSLFIRKVKSRRLIETKLGFRKKK